MKKKRNWLRNIIWFIIFATVTGFLIIHFNVIDKINNYFTDNNINFFNLFIEKPKLKIIDEESKTRPIAVSINNNHAAWPLSGLQDAYIVYELIAEGGITRLLAFYKDANTTKIGSVRSARHYFLDYVLENDAIFVHFGQSPAAKEDLSQLNINNINGLYTSSPFKRDKSLGRASEHTAFTSISAIEKEVSKKKYRSTTDNLLLKYKPTKVKLDKDKVISATNVSLKYSSYQTTSYKYNEEKMVYELYMSNKLQKDLVTKEVYNVKNIITYQVNNKSLDSKGRQDLENIGTGEGFFISNGEAIKIKWEKKNRKEKTKYMYEDGTEINVNDGNTWIHIVPTKGNIKIN